MGYDYYGPSRGSKVKSESQVRSHLASLGFKTTIIGEVVDRVERAIEIYDEYDKVKREQLPYLTDGLVLKIEDFEVQEKFGVQNGRPGWAIAIKPSSKSVITTVTGLTWDNRKSAAGQFCPVAHVVPTPFDGTTLRNVNMFNLDFLTEWVKKGFGIGAEIIVTRTGDVLPYLTGVVREAPVSDHKIPDDHPTSQPPERSLGELESTLEAAHVNMALEEFEESPDDLSDLIKEPGDEDYSDVEREIAERRGDS